jgi:hypothetical protein
MFTMLFVLFFIISSFISYFMHILLLYVYIKNKGCENISPKVYFGVQLGPEHFSENVKRNGLPAALLNR